MNVTYAIAALNKTVGNNAWFLVEAADSKGAWSEARRLINVGQRVKLVDGETLATTGEELTLSRSEHKIVTARRLDAVRAKDRGPDIIALVNELEEHLSEELKEGIRELYPDAKFHDDEPEHEPEHEPAA